MVNRSLVIGLTGGIGAGKSVVAQYFAQLGITVIDADLIARQVVEPGMPALQAIIQRFGNEIVGENGSLNRALLREIIFKDPVDREWLENLTHPMIYQAIQTQIEHSQSSYCIVVIPLLLEKNQTRQRVDRILVVDAPETLQRDRAVKRDKTSAENIQSIMNAQLTREERLAAADDVLVNDQDLRSLERKILALHELYLSIARGSRGDAAGLN